jgi:hypothetical protein
MSFESSSKKELEKKSKKTKKQSNFIKELKLFFTPMNIILLSLILIGILLLITVVVIIWTDLAVYQKDITTIFFENRSKQLISLGLGLQLIHYYLLSIAFVGTGISLYILQKK